MASDNAFLWDMPLTPDERESLIDHAARAVVKRGLQAPAVFALEMHKPLAFLASQMMVVSAPLFGPLIGIDRMQSWGRLLAEPGAVEAVLSRIEDLTEQLDAASTRSRTKAT